MALTQEDLQAIRLLMQEENATIRADLSDLKGDVAALKQGQAELEQGQADLAESLQIVRNSQMRVELEQFPRIAAALDGAVGGNEKNSEQDRRIEVLENKAENQGNRILAVSVKRHSESCWARSHQWGYQID